MTTRAGKRETNRLQVRRDLALAAVRLFDVQGFDNATVDEIVSEANVSRRTFFRHFPTKADVVFYDHEERLAGIETALSHVAAEQPPLQALAELTEAIVPSFIEPKDFFLTRHRVLRANEALSQREQVIGLTYARMLARFLSNRLAGHPQGRLLADVIAMATVTVVNRAQYDWASSGGTTDAVAATKAGMELIVDVFGRVIEPQRGRNSRQPTLVVITQDGVIQPEVLERLGRALSE
jgi:TetR/AcrR family transcriptional regulator, regulator of mycofactocin system